MVKCYTEKSQLGLNSKWQICFSISQVRKCITMQKKNVETVCRNSASKSMRQPSFNSQKDNWERAAEVQWLNTLQHFGERWTIWRMILETKLGKNQQFANNSFQEMSHLIFSTTSFTCSYYVIFETIRTQMI